MSILTRCHFYGRMLHRYSRQTCQFTFHIISQHNKFLGRVPHISIHDLLLKSRGGGFIVDKSMSKHTDTYLLTKQHQAVASLSYTLLLLRACGSETVSFSFNQKIFHILHSNTSFAHTQTYSPDEWGLHKLQVLFKFSIMSMVFLCFNPYHIPWYCPFI